MLLSLTLRSDNARDRGLIEVAGAFELVDLLSELLLEG